MAIRFATCAHDPGHAAHDKGFIRDEFRDELFGLGAQRVKSFNNFFNSLAFHVLYDYNIIMYTSQPPSVHRVQTPRGVAVHRTHHIGPHPVIHYFLERMNLKRIVNECVAPARAAGGRDGMLNHGEVVEILVHNVLVSPAPLYRLADWAVPVEAYALGLTPEQKGAVNDDRVARALTALSSERGRNLFFRLALRVLKEFSLKTGRVHFDTTSVTLYGAYATSVAEPAIRHGYSKDHRPDLKQLVFGLNVTADGAVPLLHNLYSGNRTDDTVHRGNIESLRRLLCREDFIYVADSKLCTKPNLKYIAAAEGKFVTVLPRSRREDRQFREHLRKEGVRWCFLVDIPSKRRKDDPPDRFSACAGPFNTTEEGYRLIWLRSSQKALLDRRARDASIQAALAELDALIHRLNRRKYKTRAAIKKAVAAILKTHGARDFLDVRIRRRTEVQIRRLRQGRPTGADPVRKILVPVFSLEPRIQKERLKEEECADGVFPLVTNLDEKQSRKDVLLIYKYQPYVEKRFSALKSELLVSPVFLKKPPRVAGMIHAYFIAILVSSLMERCVRTNMSRNHITSLPLLPEERETETPTCPRILEAFSALTWYDFQQEDNYVAFPLKLTGLHKTLLKLLEVPEEIYS